MGSYHKLSGNDDEIEVGHFAPNHLQRYTLQGNRLVVALIAFTASLLANVVLLTWLTQFYSPTSREWRTTQSQSFYAELTRDQPIPIGQHPPYNLHNLTEVRDFWEEISIDDGMVALPDSLVAEKGLPEAQRFPWDQSKGLYFLNGYHNLHCLRAVHISLIEFANGEPQSRYFGHVLHCMESLRQDILCNADDTPRYTTNTTVPESGVGQARQCRSWEIMRGWAKKYNACYRFVNQTARGFPNVLRFRFCPEGSPYKKEVDEVFQGLQDG